MNFKLLRNQFSSKSTVGELYLDGVRLCYTLEDVDRGLTHDMTPEAIAKIKIPKQTCIPYGRYKIKWQPSLHFKCDMPYLQDVPGFTFTMFHVGNSDLDVEGCIAVGKAKGNDRIMQSTGAFGDFKSLWLTHHDVSDWVEIVKGGDATVTA